DYSHLLERETAPGEASQRRRACDHEGGGTGDAGPCGRLGIGLNQHALLGDKKLHQASSKWVTEFLGAVQFIETGKNVFAASVARTQVDTLAAQRPHAARCENFEREIECERAGVKQVERPEINGAARQISAARRL